MSSHPPEPLVSITKSYPTKFTADVIRNGLALFRSYFPETHREEMFQSQTLGTADGESITIDNQEEFFLKYLLPFRFANILAE